MTSIFVLDCSWSMNRFVVDQHGSQSATCFETMRKVMGYFMKEMKEKCPMENVTVVCSISDIHSACENFAKAMGFNHDRIPKRAHGTFRLTEMLQGIKSQSVDNVFLKSQVGATKLIIITDNQYIPVDLDGFDAEVYVISVTKEHENHQQSSHMYNLDECPRNLTRLSVATTICDLESTAIQLFMKMYKPYIGHLHFGAITYPITIVPNPCFDEVRLGQALPTELCVYGFLPQEAVQNVPFSKEYEIASRDSIKQNQVSETADPIVNTVHTEDVQLSPALVMLHDSLVNLKLASIVQIEDNWFAILNAFFTQAKRELKLMVLHRNVTIPWIGAFDKLTGSEREVNAGFTPQNMYLKSYNLGKEYGNCFYSLTEGSVKVDVNKIISKIKDLPKKKESFLQDVHRLQKSAECLHSPEALQILALVLELESNRGDLEPSVADILRTARMRLLEASVL
eukprot:TRINITY_DN8956_c0_g1_i2.p1 TRINITY_DN8956_c0_g1~~TRINITY_DN8956_c0_g1_i2.p1  ORF type:complete len:454 (-),score=83.65 TRINITY_DN8956_c0_g1_i2:231-1592(-)